KPVLYDKVNISVRNFSFTSEFPFELAAQLPGGGDLKISGKAGPVNATDDSRTPLETAVKVNNLNISPLCLLPPTIPNAGLLNFYGKLTSHSSQDKAEALFTGKQLKFSPKGTPAPKTVTVKHAVSFNLAKQSGTITQGDVAVGSAQAHLTGTFQLQGEAEVVNLKLDAPNMSVDE